MDPPRLAVQVPLAGLACGLLRPQWCSGLGPGCFFLKRACGWIAWSLERLDLGVESLSFKFVAPATVVRTGQACLQGKSRSAWPTACVV